MIRIRLGELKKIIREIREGYYSDLDVERQQGEWDEGFHGDEYGFDPYDDKANAMSDDELLGFVGSEDHDDDEQMNAYRTAVYDRGISDEDPTP